MAFDRRGHLYYGFNGGHNEYFVREVNVDSGQRLRAIDFRPSFSFSSVATDDHNILYVNTKSLVGGDVKLFKPGETTPYIEVKDPLTPLTIHIARDSLWVGYQGAFADALARYRLRSTHQTWLKSVGNYAPTELAVNPDGSLIAAKMRRNGQSSVKVYDVKSSRSTQLHQGDTQAIASDDSGHLYIAQRQSRILICTFQQCGHSFETNLEITALAVGPLDGMLYVASNGATNGQPGVYVYNPRTTSLIRYISTGKQRPNRIAIEPQSTQKGSVVKIVAHTCSGASSVSHSRPNVSKGGPKSTSPAERRQGRLAKKEHYEI